MYLMHNSYSDMVSANALCHSDGNCGSDYEPVQKGIGLKAEEEPRERHEGRETERMRGDKRYDVKTYDGDCRAYPAFSEYHGQQFNWNREATTFEPGMREA